MTVPRLKGKQGRLPWSLLGKPRVQNEIIVGIYILIDIEYWIPMNQITHFSFKIEVPLCSDIIIHHHEVFPSSQHTVKVVVSIIMNHRTSATITDPKVRLMCEIFECATHNTWNCLKVQRKNHIYNSIWSFRENFCIQTDIHKFHIKKALSKKHIKQDKVYTVDPKMHLLLSNKKESTKISLLTTSSVN